MQETIQLSADGVNHRRRPVPRIQAADAARKIDEAVAVNIFDDCSFRLGHEDRSSVIRRLDNRGIAPLHQSLRAGTGYRSAQMNCRHDFILSCVIVDSA